MITLPPSADFVVDATPPEALEMHTHVCPDCQQAHESLFRGTSAVCPACLERRQQALRSSEQDKLALDATAAKAAAWDAMCPPDYRRTQWREHPELSRVCWWAAKEWRLAGPGRDPRFGHERGLLIYGPTGRGKTRAMFGILRRLHWSGISCAAVEAVRYAEHAVTAHDLRAPWQTRRDSQQFLERAKSVRALFFDDLGKEGASPGFARAFHDLLEHRKAHQLATLVTSERVGDELAQHLGTNYADGIVRRLRETCAVLHTEQEIPTVNDLTHAIE